MLEWQWLADHDPKPMLRFLGSRPTETGGQWSRPLGRKLRLFTFGCCHRVRHLAGRRTQEAFALFERLLEETVPGEELRGAQQAAKKEQTGTSSAPGGEYPATCALGRAGSDGPIGELVACAVATANDAEVATAMAAEGKHYRHGHAATAAFRVAGSAERAYQLGLVHDIFGNPFRPVNFSPTWRTDTAVVLARQMYEAREFSAMPILADALQDAGCEVDAILSHCQGDGLHVRGCWVVDLVLGKE